MQVFCRQVWLVLLILVMSSSLSFADVMDRRQDNIGVREICGSYRNEPFVTGTINKSPSFVAENCVGSEFFGDWALEFDISELKQAFPSNFDVNNIYIDGKNNKGERALNVMREVSFQDNGTSRLLSLQHGHWSENKVSFCVGATARTAIALIPGDTVYLLENKIYLWYKQPNEFNLNNVSATDICTTNGNNWMQKLLEGFLGGLSNSAFCADPNNKGNLKMDTLNNTTTLTSKVPLTSSGAKTLTIPFSQAGVTSAQVKAGIGKGYGGNSNGGPQGTGAGYDPDPNGDTWAGYAHHVGLKYVKVGKKSSGHWHGSKVWSIDQRPNRRDFRVKLKRKGGVWPNQVCAEIWFSHNKYFTDEDWHLKTKCKDLSNESDNYKSVYVKDVYIPNEMEAGKNYYFFTRVTYSGGVNPSSRSDSDEYVKVEIIDFSSEFEVDTVIGEVPLGVFFNNKSKLIKNDGVSGSISYNWDFGDGTTSTEENPTHLYENPGTYTARLTTTASWGETKTSQLKVVTVLEEEGLSVAEKMDILW